jgi:hypothetical protein
MVGLVQANARYTNKLQVHGLKHECAVRYVHIFKLVFQIICMYLLIQPRSRDDLLGDLAKVELGCLDGLTFMLVKVGSYRALMRRLR